MLSPRNIPNWKKLNGSKFINQTEADVVILICDRVPNKI